VRARVERYRLPGTDHQRRAVRRPDAAQPKSERRCDDNAGPNGTEWLHHYTLPCVSLLEVRALNAHGRRPRADFTMAFAGPFIVSVDAGHPIIMLAGVHLGCFELFGSDQVRTIRDLKGKTVAVQSLQSSQHVFLSSMAAYVGLDPRKDINRHLRYGPCSLLFRAGKRTT